MVMPEEARMAEVKYPTGETNGIRHARD